MGIFSDNLVRLYESGLVCIPVGDRKAPLLKEWQHWCENVPPVELIEKWETQYRQVDRLGLCLGASSGLVAFDWDYAYDEKRVAIDKVRFEKDRRVVEEKVFRMLPQSPARKVGRKGGTWLYKWGPRLGPGSNVAADRNGVRMFDFLSWHKQTIIPPSIHSSKDGVPLYYKWDGPDLLECLDDIPDIELDLILEIKNLFGESNQTDSNNRHKRLFNYLMSMASIEKNREKLIHLLIEKDRELHLSDAKGPYLLDKTHTGGESSEDFASNWVSRILKWKEARADKVEGAPQTQDTGDVWNYFFEKSFPLLRKDVLSEKVMVKRDDQSAWTDVMAIEGVFKTYAANIGLPRTHVKDQLERFVFERTKLEFLCDIPPWDGIDRLDVFGKCIVSSEFSGEEMALILKHWGSGIFRRIHDADEQNRCLILKGGQGIGKDSLVKSMLSDFRPYFDTTNLSGTQKDVYEIISRIFVLHIEEFEQTAKLDIAFIKSIITQSSAFFRESFGREPSSKKVRLSMVSTSNRDDILRDPTGNRRFIVVPVDKLVWNYPRKESLQVVAQFKSLFEQGLHQSLPEALETKIKVILERFTPPEAAETIIDMYQIKFAALTSPFQKSVIAPYPGRTSLRGGEIQPALQEIARGNDVGPNRVKSILKANHYSRREMGGTVYYQTPFAWKIAENLQAGN